MMKRQTKLTQNVGYVVLAFSGLIFFTDIVFDALTADILSFGVVMNLASVQNAWVHWLFRILLGGMSLVGEALALAIIMGMPVLKEMIGDALPNYPTGTYRPPQNQQRSQPYRSTTPAYNNIPAGIPRAAPKQVVRPVPVQTTFMAPEPTYTPIGYDDPNS